MYPPNRETKKLLWIIPQESLVPFINILKCLLISFLLPTSFTVHLKEIFMISLCFLFIVVSGMVNCKVLLCFSLSSLALSLWMLKAFALLVADSNFHMWTSIKTLLLPAASQPPSQLTFKCFLSCLKVFWNYPLTGLLLWENSMLPETPIPSFTRTWYHVSDLSVNTIKCIFSNSKKEWLRNNS